MRSASLKEIVEIIGIAAIVGSLIFVGFQLQQSEQIGISDAVANRNERVNALRTQIIENAAVWHKACAGEPLEPDERHVAAAIYDIYSLNIRSSWITSTGGLINSDRLQRQIIYTAAMQLWAFPGLEKLEQARTSIRELRGITVQDGRNSALFQGINNRLAELNSSDVQPDVDIALCGII